MSPEVSPNYYILSNNKILYSLKKNKKKYYSFPLFQTKKNERSLNKK